VGYSPPLFVRLRQAYGAIRPSAKKLNDAAVRQTISGIQYSCTSAGRVNAETLKHGKLIADGRLMDCEEQRAKRLPMF